MNNPIVSVIIPLYNGALLVHRCIDSVFSQVGNFNLEVIIIDDGSTDDSVDIINQYPKQLQLIQQSNQGPAAARNKGIAVATGKYLAFLDADDYWEPDFLYETVSFMELNPELAAVSVGQLHKSVSCNARVQPLFLTQNKNEYFNTYIIDDFFLLWKDHEIVCTGSVLIKTIFAKKIGGQREDLRVTEDIEFWACIAAIGNWGFVPKVLFVSDGVLISKNSGWIEKNKKRWDSAPTIDIWEKRILTLFNKRIPDSYYLFRGKIVQNLIYSILMSKRINLSYQLIKENRDQLPINKISILYKVFSVSKITWKILAYFLIKREYKRKV